MTSPPTVSVVIPSYRRLDRLAPLVARYLEQGADEIVVVLDGPHEGWRSALAGVIESPRLRVVELAENRGLALARIAGLEAAGGDVILLTDDDVIPGHGLVDRHRAFHAAGGDRVLLGSMPVGLARRWHRDDAASRLYARDYERQMRVWRGGDSAVVLGSLWGGNVSLPRDLYLRAEASRPSVRLEYNEDLDLGLRLLRLGAEAAFDESAAATHEHRRSFDGFLAESVSRGRALADLERRWGEIPPQLLPLVRIPPGYRATAARVQRRIAARDAPGALESGLRAGYRLMGLARRASAQEAILRLLRRGLVMRGYRLASAEHPSPTAAEQPAG